jgi:HrpA-like RNA helicase
VNIWARLGLAAKNAIEAKAEAQDRSVFFKRGSEITIDNFEDVSIPKSVMESNIPIASRYAELISTISSNPVTIVSAETGFNFI